MCQRDRTGGAGFPIAPPEPPPNLKLWLSVREGDNIVGGGDLWERWITAAFAPGVGDRLLVLRSDEEPEGSVDMKVKSRWWDHAGVLNVELEPVTIDPGEQWDRMQMWRYGPSWFTEREGEDLRARLAESGWTEYRP